MKKLLKNIITSLIIILVFLISCKPKNDQAETPNINSLEIQSTIPNPIEEDLKIVVEDLLFAVGNYNIEDLDAMMSDKAMLGISLFRDETWSNSEIAISDFFETVKNRENSPYCEIPNSYDILITENRIALVRADCILYKWGIPKTHEVNHFTLIKEDEKWKILNISWTNVKLAEDKKIYDLNVFARGYAQAWCSNRPNFVSSFFDSNGSLMVNNGEPAIGTEAITQVAKGFMDSFPDLHVAMDSLTTDSDKTRFYWTLTGTNNAPGGTGNKVNISGYEEWTLNKDGLILDSRGHFDNDEYQRQLEFGTNN